MLHVPHRFYAPDAGVPGDLVTLAPDEAAHLTRVLRLRTGDPVRVFDGRGREFDAVVDEGGRRVRLRLTAARAAAPEPSVRITLAPAILKGDHMDDVVRDAVMIGVATVQPVVAARCEVPLSAIARGGRLERWQRVAVASAKQCGRAVVPVVRPACDVGALLASLRGEPDTPVTVMFVEPGAAADTSGLDALDAPPASAVTVLVGPEGGWTAEEIALGAGVARLVTLRTPTIRANAMAVVGVTALLAKWGRL